VHREEIYVKIQNENRKASNSEKEDLGSVVRLLREKYNGEIKDGDKKADIDFESDSKSKRQGKRPSE